MYSYTYILGIFDIVLPPILLLLIYLYSTNVAKRKIRNEPEYKYYVPGLFFKIFFAIALCFIYLFYYNGGDTIGYFEDATTVINVLLKNFKGGLSILMGDTSPENYILFDRTTGYVSSYWNDQYAFFVVRFITPLVLLTQSSYISTTILLAWICYSGVWKLYKVFSQEFPGLHKKLAIAVLFIPSVAFWGSGILKDTITFAAVSWFTYAIYTAVIPSKKSIYSYAKIGLHLFVSTYLIIALKPYVLYPLLPGVTFLVLFKYINVIRNKVVKFMIIPFVIGIAFTFSMYLLTSLGDQMGRFSFDNVLQNAVDVQYDLKQDYYQGSSFDIGEFTPTIGGVLGKFPQAVTAGLFRPFIWEANNVAMIISGIENLVFLIITLRIVFNGGFYKSFSFIAAQPLLVYALSFSIILIFIVGLTTANFGSLVRYRIPALPFFLSALFILEAQINHRKRLVRSFTPVGARSKNVFSKQSDEQQE